MSANPLAQQTLESILAPVREAAKVVEREIEQLETELQAKRDELKPLMRVLRAADPNVARPGPKPAKRASNVWTPSDESIEIVQAFLMKHASKYQNGDGFTSTNLYRDMRSDSGTTKLSDETVRRSVKVLHERGVLRLLRRGTGGGRIYQLSV